MKKSSIFAILLILVLTVSMFGFTSCSKNSDAAEPDSTETAAAEEDAESEDSDFDHPEYANEQEDADVREKKASQDDFFGSWTAKSDRAEYLYGNIDLTIKPDGTWTGNVTEEDWSGKWEYNGTGITLSSDIINCDLFFASDGVLMFRDHDDPDDLIALFEK